MHSAHSTVASLGARSDLRLQRECGVTLHSGSDEATFSPAQSSYAIALDRDEAPEVPRGPHISPTSDLRAFHSGLPTPTSISASPCDSPSGEQAPADGLSQGVRPVGQYHRGTGCLGISDMPSGDSPASRRGSVPPFSSRHDMASRLQADDCVPARDGVAGVARVAEEVCQSPKLLVVPDMPLQSLSFG